MEFDNKTLRKAVELWLINKEKAFVKYGDINTWNTSNVTDMSYLFFDAEKFNCKISEWDTSNVTDMNHIFCCATQFNQDIGKWNTCKITDMKYMFHNALVFNQDISKWSTYNVVNMSHMFHNALVFNQDITNWNTSNVYDMECMFHNAKLFNQDILLLNMNNVALNNGTLLSSRLNGSKWTDRKVMDKLFPYSRRKNFLMFLIKCRYIPHKHNYIETTYHKIFSIEDIYKSIMSYI